MSDSASPSTSSSSSDPAAKIASAAEAAAITVLAAGESIQQGDVSISRTSAAAAWEISQKAAAKAAAKSGTRPLFRGISFNRMF